jgi:Tol biopolymer transport system component
MLILAGILEDSFKLERRIKMIAKFKKTLRKRSVAAVLVLAVLACITLTDAYPDEPPFIFGTPTNLGPTVNSSYTDYCLRISADGLELYFSSRRSGGYGLVDIWVTTRATTDINWGTPVNLGPTVNSSSTDSGPSISADGLSLFFHSWRPGGHGGGDLYVTTRVTTKHPWRTPMNLGPPVSSSYDEILPSISSDGLQLYFSEWEVLRPGGYGGSDIWVTTRETISSPWGTPVNLGPTVNSSSHDDGPFITADGLMLFFSPYNRPGGFGGVDLWVTTRPTTEDDWVTPVNLGPEINSSYHEEFPSISADGSTLYFDSDLPGGVGDYDLWQVQIRPRRTIADFNRDKKVDFKDFSKLAQYLGQNESSVDIAPPLGDGIIDFEDVGVFSESWLLSMMQARNPNPADNATGIVVDANLSWTPSDEAALHKVYFGSEPSALPLVATQPRGQDSYDPPGDLNLSTTYYWWIDEVNDAGPPPDKWPGVLWSFNTIRGQAHTPSPADDAVIPGDTLTYLGNDYIWTNLIFLPGPTAEPDPNVRRAYFSKNRDDVANRVQDANLGPPPYGSIPGYETKYYAGNPMVAPANDTLVRGTTYYWCGDETDADGHTYPGDIWEFTIQGFYAFRPSPPNDAILVDPNVLLSWGEGYGVQEHDIYLGTSWNDVNNAEADDVTGIYRGFRMDPNYPCSNLELTTRFYWRVDEVQGRLPPLFPGIIYKGDVWNFTSESLPPP